MKNQLLRNWLFLLGLQLFCALVVLSGFIFGKYHFAYLDIGGDSYSQFVPYAMHMARTASREVLTGWSFMIGLGNQASWTFGDATMPLFAALVGPDRILSLRIWVYLLKILTGGAFFFLFIDSLVVRRVTAVICALAYSFCGFMVVNGQWDPQATEFVFFPLILWAIVRHLQTGNSVILPLSVAVSLIFGVFFVALGVFIVFAGIFCVLVSDNYKAMLKIWLTRIYPLTIIGYLIAAPILLPIILQMLDSSRIGGEESLFRKILSQTFTVNNWNIILMEVGSIFHKDIYGIGNQHKGWFNYLESPGFYFGIFLFIIIPQLWNGSKTDRKLLSIGIICIFSYLIFPFFRYAAMGFAAPYFRVSSLWVTLVFLLLAARSLDHSIEKGINTKMVIVGIGICILLLGFVLMSQVRNDVSMLHAAKVIGIALFSGLYLLLFARGIIGFRYFPMAAICLVMTEIILISRPSFYDGRALVPSGFDAYNDGTMEVLERIKKKDNDVYRIEKTYNSVSLADSLAQNYRGIKSYYLHSRGVVDFFRGMGLISPLSSDNSTNWTNWLPNAGNRYILNSLLGVKYILTREAIDWPGFSLSGKIGKISYYRNAMALPFGVVHSRQIQKETLSNLAEQTNHDKKSALDIALMNAVVVDQFIPGYGELVDEDFIVNMNKKPIQNAYFDPARALQKTGLTVEKFTNNQISGYINPVKDGILVFSIPFNPGWSLKIDEIDAPLIRANFGMLAAKVKAGSKKIELNFQAPGQDAGLILGILGILILWRSTLQQGKGCK